MSLISTPARVVSTPFAPAVSFAPSESVPHGSRAVSRTLVPRHAPHRRLASRHPSQFPMAHRLSVPRARVTETFPRRAPPLRARANCNLKAGPGSRPAEDQRTSVPSHDCPASPASGLHHPKPGPRPAGRPPPSQQVRPEPIPTQARASATGATSTGQQVGIGRRSAEEAIGRFIVRKPGCTILAPVAAWQLLPGSGAFSALGHFGSTTRPRSRGGEWPSQRG
jgi:hypothetical protein